MAGIFGSTYGLNLARGTIAAPTLGTRPTLAGFGSFFDDETDSGASLWDQVSSYFSDEPPSDSGSSDSNSANTANVTPSDANPPPNCWPRFLGDMPPSSTIPYCNAADEAKWKARPTGTDSIVANGPLTPNDATTFCTTLTGQVDPKCVTSYPAFSACTPDKGTWDWKTQKCVPKAKTGGTGTAGTPKPVAPVEKPETSNVGLYALAGALVLGGVGYIVYKKKQKAKGYSGSY